ncbi:hypothetical protein XI04_03845 [Bradyrhizobium sp. CCBAU 11430]|nr:hypothetical protein [Bradyrhizobium sp. CCBAU 11430]
MVDADPKSFPVETLVKWKRDAQTQAFRELVSPSTVFAEPARIEAAIVADTDQADAEFIAIFDRVRAAANMDISSRTRGTMWERDSVELSLGIVGDMETPSFNISRLPLAVEAAPEVTIVASPGTGKTTTIFQLAKHALTANSLVPLYFRLGDWAAGQIGLLASLHHRAAFRNISAEDINALAARGRLLLLLDGWNELDLDAHKRLRVEVGQIRRNWPDVRIIVTTRQQALDVPIMGPRVEIDLLSEDQQLAIAAALYGPVGEKIVDNAWRTPGVRSLIAIPLYLTSLLAVGSKGAPPDTKEAVLRLFVEQHERAPEHADALQFALLGCHTEILTDLACRLNALGPTTLPEADARRFVADASAGLRERGQIAAPFEPSAVLEALTSHHLLMRSGDGVAFQHQQFQEWYASRRVVELMKAAANGDAGARVELRASVLDRPSWEESVLFATERLSRESNGAEVVAHAVRLALPIDPMLAAEMIFRAAPAVWDLVRDDIIAFAARWHQAGKADRAVRFMIMTGRPEFAAQVWPLASSSDRQIQIPTLRGAPYFRPRVLGDDLQAKLAGLAEETREQLLSMIAGESGLDGMDLAVELAKADSSSKVQAEVVQNLQFRRADHHVADLLSSAHDETWELIARAGYAREIRDDAVAKRLQEIQSRLVGTTTDPSQRLGLLFQQSADVPGRDTAIAAAIADQQFVTNNPQSSWLYLAQRAAPAALLEGLRQRLAAGYDMPLHADDVLLKLDVIDTGPIVDAVLNTDHDDRKINAAAALVGQTTIEALIDKFLSAAKALHEDRSNRALSDEYICIESRLHCTRPAIFAAAVLRKGESDDPNVVDALASLVAHHGVHDRGGDKPLVIDPTSRGAWIELLRRWAGTVLAIPAGGRRELSHVASAIGRLGFDELVPELKRLLDEDLLRLRNARAGRADALRRGDIVASSDASMIYDIQYRSSFIRIGGDAVARVAAQYLEDRDFGISAALILKSISDRQLNVPAPSFNRRWPWFDGVDAARKARAASPRPAPANALAAPIFAAIDRLARPEREKEDQLLAINLMRVGLGMPHGDRDDLVARVVALPQPLATKPMLLAAMVLDGQIIDADLLTRAINDWLSAANQDPNAWHKRQETWEIEPWLELLPFSTQPEAVFEGLVKVKAFYGRDWAKRWERVLTAVAAIPGPLGDELLLRLAREHRDIADDHTWMRAFLERGAVASVLLYLDLYNDGMFGRGPNGVDAWHIGRQLAAYAQRSPELNSELQKRYETIGDGPGRKVLEQFFGEAAGENDIVAMVKKYAATKQSYDGQMHRALEAVATEKVPIGEDSNAYNVYPAPVGELRKALFGMLDGTPAEAAIARRCLKEIDELRDEHGIAADDGRHPDVMSERPWPPEAKTS